jgi:hypothetical protein
MPTTREDRSGRWLGLPYDWRPLTSSRLKRRAWNPDDSRVLTPKAYGWGLGVNCHALLRRLRILRR